MYGGLYAHYINLEHEWCEREKLDNIQAVSVFLYGTQNSEHITAPTT